MATSPPNAPENGQPGKSRLDREIEEILSRNDNIRQLPPPPKPPRQKPTPIRAAPGSSPSMPPQLRRALSAPVVQALLLAFVAYLVQDLSPLLANLLALAAVVCLLWPMAQRFRRPASPPETRMWRGQVIEVQPRSRSQSPIDSVRDWWRSKRG